MQRCTKKRDLSDLFFLYRSLFSFWVLTFFLFPSLTLAVQTYDSDQKAIAENSAQKYFIIFLVESRQLDYSNPRSLLRTIVKHPSDWSKNGDVGHAWIYLHGDVVIEGGHSGELGIVQPRYWEGVYDGAMRGDSNPVEYLWSAQADGFFQKGSGDHLPTCAVKVDLTKKEYEAIRSFIHPAHYDYSNYALGGNQCSSFLVQIAQIIGIDLEADVTLHVPMEMRISGRVLRLRSDPEYAEFTFSSPDRLEQSLRRVVLEGNGEDVLDWYKKVYRKKHRPPLKKRLERCCSDVMAFPARFYRYVIFL